MGFQNLEHADFDTVIEALGDAVDYRGDLGECVDCDDLPGDELCDDHQYDTDKAEQYAELHDRLKASTTPGAGAWVKLIGDELACIADWAANKYQEAVDEGWTDDLSEGALSIMRWLEVGPFEKGDES